jgi:hypothetical protein
MNQGASRAKCNAVGPRLERGVRRHRATRCKPKLALGFNCVRERTVKTAPNDVYSMLRVGSCARAAIDNGVRARRGTSWIPMALP